MFLTDKHQPVPVPSSPYQSVPSHHLHLSGQFNEALSSRLVSLLSPTIDLSWLSRATDVLSLTLADATSLLLLNPSSQSPSPLLDSTSLTLLDSCNSISNFTDQILNRLMFLRFSLRTHKHTFAEVLPLPDISKIHPLSSEKAPRGDISPVQDAIYAVEAVSALVISAISVILFGKGKQHFHGLKVHTEIFPWAREFNKVIDGVAVYGRTGEDSVQIKLERMEMAVLKGELEMNGGKEKMERIGEEMREGLERFKGSVNAVFRAALCSRNAAVQNLRVGPKKKCK